MAISHFYMEVYTVPKVDNSKYINYTHTYTCPYVCESVGPGIHPKFQALQTLAFPECVLRFCGVPRVTEVLFGHSPPVRLLFPSKFTAGSSAGFSLQPLPTSSERPLRGHPHTNACMWLADAFYFASQSLHLCPHPTPTGSSGTGVVTRTTT